MRMPIREWMMSSKNASSYSSLFCAPPSAIEKVAVGWRTGTSQLGITGCRKACTAMRQMETSSIIARDPG